MFSLTVNVTIAQGQHDAAYDILSRVCQICNQSDTSAQTAQDTIGIVSFVTVFSLIFQVFDLSKTSLGATTTTLDAKSFFLTQHTGIEHPDTLLCM